METLHRTETVHITEGDALVVSDTHFAAGAEIGGRPNPYEFFFSDREFAGMLKSWKKRCAERRRTLLNEGLPDEKSLPSRKRWLIMNGDMIDYHAIPHDKTFRCVPTEAPAREETYAAVKGHQIAWSAIADFVRLDLDSEIVFVLGNHDLELVWPSVQDIILDRIDPARTSRHRIHFTREARIGDDVLIVHGDELDGLSRKPKPEFTFITGKVETLPAILAAALLLFTYSALIGVAKAMWSRSFSFSLEEVLFASVGFFALLSLVSAVVVKAFFSSIGKEKVYLNHPTSTYMNSWLGQRLRKWMPWIGRMQNHGAIWFLSLVHNWSAAFVALPVTIAYLLYHRFIIEPVDPRREHKRAHFTLWETLKLFRSTMRSDQYEVELEAFIKRHPDARHVIMGHTHVPEDRIIHLSERKLRYLNTGTMIRQVRLITPQPETKPFSWVKMFFWRIGVYWRKRPKRAFALTALHLVLAPLAFWGFRHFGWDVSAWLILAIAGFSLFWRQSYAQYRGEEFTEFTPVEIRMTSNGTREVSLMQFFPAQDKWVRYLES